MEIVVDGITYLFGKIGEGIAWLLKEGMRLIGSGTIVLIKYSANCPEVFILVGIIGMIIVITGRKELGTKITSGGIITYLIAKAVDSIW